MKKWMTRLLSWLLAAAMLCSFAVPIRAAGTAALPFQKTDNDTAAGCSRGLGGEEPDSPRYTDGETVRVSVSWNGFHRWRRAFSPANIARDARASAYRQELQRLQDSVVASIQRRTGEELDVVWNLTLAANIISANVEYGQIPQIEAIDGVEKVVLETRYTPDGFLPGRRIRIWPPLPK